MTQMATRAGSSTAPTGVVTVADLLTRYAPDPMLEADPPTVPVSVDSLLRREGRAPHTPDRPVAARARPAAVPDDEDDERRRGPGALVRRGAIAAGTLLAAGSVFGATVVMDASSTGAAPQATGGYAGEGRLDLPANPDGTVPTVVDTAAQADRLDAGDAPPMSWLDVAFPDGDGDGSPTGDGATAPSGSSSAPGTARPVTPGPVVDDADRGGSADTGSDTGSGDSSGAGRGDGDQGDGDGGLGSALQGAGESVGGPVGGVVGGLGGAVGDAGSTDDSDGPSVIGGLAGSLLG